MSASISERVAVARANAPRIREALSTSPPEYEPSGVYAAMSDYRDDILAAIRRGWAVSQLATLLLDAGVAFSKQSVAKAIDQIIDDAIRAGLSAGAKPAAIAKRVLGVNIDTASDQVKTRINRRITRLTHPTSPSSKNDRGNRNA